MIYAFILVPIFTLLLGGALGYLVGRHQTALLDRIRTLEERGRAEPEPEPEKPVVLGGAYQPPKEISTAVDKKHVAGLVETKTPQQLDWENQAELERLRTAH